LLDEIKFSFIKKKCVMDTYMPPSIPERKAKDGPENRRQSDSKSNLWSVCYALAFFFTITVL
jgi:hypothetical protein